MDLDNAAFEERDQDAEIARILHNIAGRIQQYGRGTYTLYDVNGNNVGECTASKD
jgi:hypothetical protein